MMFRSFALLGALMGTVYSATIDNTDVASTLQGAASAITGSYYITNVGTGKALTYDPNGNDLYPSSGNGDAVTLTAYGSNVAWVRLAVGAKNKCVSAQWGDNGDTAAVMYACQVGAGGSTTSGSTLEPTKQWWIFVPVDGASDGDWGDSQVSLLAKAQKQSVSIRTAANSKRALSRHRRARGFGHDEHFVVERSEVDMSEGAIERRSTSAAKKRAAAKAKAAAKSKSISRSKSKSKSRSKSKSLSKSKSVSKSKSRSRSQSKSKSLSRSRAAHGNKSKSRSASVAKSKSKSKSLARSKSVVTSRSRSKSKSKSRSKSKAVSKSKSVSKSRSKSKSLSKSKSKSKSLSKSRSKAKAASKKTTKKTTKKATKTATGKKAASTKGTTLASGGSDAYWIIPTDHLLDMTTKAITSGTIATGSQTSTKLVNFDDSDENQQWVLVAA